MKSEVVKSLSFLELKKKEIEDLIEIPKDSEMGDYAFPCFVLAKSMKRNPTDIAKEIASKVKKNKFERVVASGAYVNFFVEKGELAVNILKDIEKMKDKYGSNEISKEKTMIEFSQANTHKAFHVGHVRGTSLGESLARISEFCGSKVVRANYQGDTGMHVAKWIWYYKKFVKDKSLKHDEKWVAEIYVNAAKKAEESEKNKSEVEEINRKLDKMSDKELEKLWKQTRKISLNAFEKIYSELGTKFDKYFFESEMEKRGKEISEELEKKKIAQVSDEAVIMDLKKYDLSVWVLLRKDGTVLYSAKDLALAEKKFKELKVDKSIYVVGAAQRLHFYQLFKTLELMKFKQAEKCRYIPVSEVRFPWGKMSSRTGDNVLYSDLKESIVREAKKEIGKRYKLNKLELERRALAIAVSALKYSMLKQDTNKNLIFDPKESISFEGNTGPYLLYSYARARSILRKADYNGGKTSILEIDNDEKKLISMLGQFPGIVKNAYENLAPNLIANYSYELAREFNEFYHKAQVIGSEKEAFRLGLVNAFSQVLKNSLNLLGIEVIEKM